MSCLSKWILCPAAIMVALALSGCSTQGDRPDLGYVKGKVTIDGAPFSGIAVAFLPDSGRAAIGITDAEGEYELEYLDQKGCKVGPNTVGLSVPTGGSPSHPIPKKYQNKSDLKVDVQPGNNTFDFDLVSDAPSKTPPKKAAPALD